VTRPLLVHVNLSPTLGGAEVWTADFARALALHGWRSRIVTRDVEFWSALDLGDAERVTVGDASAVAACVGSGALAVVHAPLPAPALAALRARAGLVGVAHQAVYDGRRPGYYEAATRLLAVSHHVIETLRPLGLAARTHPEPLYGVAAPSRHLLRPGVRRGPLCEWDRRKLRDVVLGALESAARGVRVQPYARPPGLVLGIVSRIAPLKQFPALFAILVPLLARRPDVRIEVFGAAIGYRSLRELRASLAPLAGRVRWWGHQDDVDAAYRAIDWLLPGLPEREALGLNLIEAVHAGTPVLAIDAPPFAETMHDGVTGFLYRDPRSDGGADFARVLDEIRSGARRPDLAAAGSALARFAFPAFAQRADAVMRKVADGIDAASD